MEELANIRKMLTRPFPMKGVERKIYACVILFIILGFLWSIEENSWIYLDKSGSAIIIVGIWFTWRDFSNTIGKYSEIKRKELLNLINQNETSPSKGIRTIMKDKVRIGLLKETEKEMQDLTKLMVRRLRIMEATLLIFGTFLNNYASVIFQYLWPLKNA